MSKKKGPRDPYKKSYTELVNCLDEAFARWVKLNWSEDGANTNCFTCDKPLTLGTKDCQCGHWVSRRHKKYRWHENNARPQCARCNSWGGGESTEFRIRLCQEIGEEPVKEIEADYRQVYKWTRNDMIDLLADLKEQVDELERLHGVV